MKKTFTTLFFASLVLLTSTAFIVKYQNGQVAGYTGSPGEQTCAGGGCHSGGSSTVKTVSMSSTPSFTGGEYLPDSVYTLSITISANGSSVTKYGFACEILDINNASAGTMQNAGTGVQFLTAANGRRNATHFNPKAGTTSATFTFKWKAPTAGAGDATIYVCGNAVNGNANTSLDSPVPGTPTVLTEGIPPVVQPTVTTSLNHNNPVTQLTVYPNPSSDFSNISYTLNDSKEMSVELIDISGRLVKELYKENESPGYHSHILNISTVPAGVYFIKTSANGTKVSQKLIAVN